MHGKKIRAVVRSIALTVVFPGLGFLLCLLAKIIFNMKVPRLTSSLVNWGIAAFAAFFLFPRLFGIPFGKIRTRDFIKKIGFYPPPDIWKHILLGMILALCTLSGMLFASLLTGKYKLNFHSVTVTHLVFCLNPGIWEEVFYRGIQMMVLLRLTKSLRMAAAIQIVIFGVSHFKGMSITSGIDGISVMIMGIGFTYTAYKTRSLVAGIVFHYFHDAFLFVVQVPGSVQTSVLDTVFFYVFLWLMVGLGCLITKWAIEKFKASSPADLYTIEAQDLHRSIETAVS
jgi:membrane protease YdiL (CAAX protease family)